jgi:hypothetical protein
VDGVAFSPRRFFSSIRSSNGSPASARLLQFVPTLAPRVHMEFEMLLEPTNGDFEICALHETTNAGVTYGVFYKEIDGQLAMVLRTLGANGGPEVKVTRPIGAPRELGSRRDRRHGRGRRQRRREARRGGGGERAALQTSTPSRASMFVELGFYSFVGASGQGPLRQRDCRLGLDARTPARLRGGARASVASEARPSCKKRPGSRRSPAPPSLFGATATMTGSMR